AVIITDTGGVDDKSYNQSSWEGLQAWGKEHDLQQGSKVYAYIQSNDAADYTTNIVQAVSRKFNTILGIGYLLKDA
ncbi:BMP family ABC transporter substrate-binding protein, partial [Enterococcus faecalis]|uniref:BMP family ABC transporter substrate-binding protein n=1 Tax=Enterococcus faecalis TaxID=1351 RepID=UPI003D6A2396